MANKSIVLVTGGNTGIGYETVKALYVSPASSTILMGSRSLEKADAAIKAIKSEVTDSKNEVVALQIDIEDDTSMDNACKEVESKYGRLDALVNNAGASFDALVMKPDPTKDDIRAAWTKAYNLNVVATQIFTLSFVPLLLKSQSPRLLFVTSGLSSLTNASEGQTGPLAGPPPKGWPKPPVFKPLAYASSKTALNMLMLDWSRTLQADGAKVFAISPGFLATGLGGHPEMLKKMGAKDPKIGGELIRDVVEGKKDADQGKVIGQGGVQAW